MNRERVVRSLRRSIAQIRGDLARLVREAESGRTIEITRRGEPVAVILSVDEHRRLVGEVGSFGELYDAWRSGVDWESVVVERGHFDGVRDRTPGRGVAF